MTESPARSLLERAARAFDFEAAARARALPIDETPAGAPTIEPFAGHAVNRRGTVDIVRLAGAGFAVPEAGASPLMEEVRIVKRQLLNAAGDSAAPRDRMILIASAREGEGKTFCAVNLALSIARERDWEVLLVDADVERPSIVGTLGLADGPGLLDALADPTVDVESCVIRTDIGSLSVLPAGAAAHNATELIASDRTRFVLGRLAEKNARRILIFDSPPALAASPASELAHHAGQTVLVVRADVTGESELREAAALLAGCDKLQLLLNGTSFRAGARRFGGYQETAK